MREHERRMIMLHPSYTDLMKVVNSDVEIGEEPVVNSRYSIVIATAKRARQLVAGEEALVAADEKKKPLSIAVDELYNGQVKIVSEEDAAEDDGPEEELEWEEGSLEPEPAELSEQAAEESAPEEEVFEENV